VTKAIVIGAGVVGASVAYRLAEAGVSVTVLEAHRVGGGTSSASFGWTNSNNKPPRPYHDLNVAGMRAHAALGEEFGRIPWWHGGGSVEWATQDVAREELRARILRLREWGYAAGELTPRRLQALEPDVDPAAVRGASIAFFPEEGWLDSVVYAHVMTDAAVRAGARVCVGARVSDIRVKGGRVTGVRTEGGEVHDGDIVVNCAGRWADDVARMAGVTLPLAPTVGLLVCTQPAPTRVRRIVRSPLCRLHPDGAGRLMLHMDDTDKQVSATTVPSLSLAPAQELVRRAVQVLPAISGAEPEAVRIGIRPIPADGYSVVGPVPGVGGYYLVVTHSGVTLAPFLGRVVAEEIATGREDPRLESFRPNRLVRV